MRPRPNVVGGVLAGVWLLIILLPVYLMLRASTESQQAYSKEGPIGLPSMFTLDNFRYAFSIGFGQYLGNSGIIAGGTVLLVVALVWPQADKTIGRYSQVREEFGQIPFPIHGYLMWLASMVGQDFGTRAMPTHTQSCPLLCTLETSSGVPWHP